MAQNETMLQKVMRAKGANQLQELNVGLPGLTTGYEESPQQEREESTPEGQQPPEPSPHEQLEQEIMPDVVAQGFGFAGHPPGSAQPRKTSAEQCRDWLLRGIEVMMQDAALPFAQHSPREYGQAALAMAEAYLLLDPDIDTEEAAGEGGGSNGSMTHAGSTKPGEVPKKVKMPPAVAKVRNKNKPHDNAIRRVTHDHPKVQPKVGGGGA
jgi:hypothetical protein